MQTYSPVSALFRLIFTYILLIGLTILIDFILHRYGYEWVGRYLGIPGTGLIIASMIYSVRKRRFVNSGKLKGYLRVHEYFSWFGAFLILIHAGIHFNAILPWIALFLLNINVISGLTGKLLLKRSLESLTSMKLELSGQGVEESEINRRIFWEALTVEIM
ncbi:MAG: hypothetical protein WCL00_13360 [Bacteroidota bacterium]